MPCTTSSSEATKSETKSVGVVAEKPRVFPYPIGTNVHTHNSCTSRSRLSYKHYTKVSARCSVDKISVLPCEYVRVIIIIIPRVLKFIDLLTS